MPKDEEKLEKDGELGNGSDSSNMAKEVPDSLSDIVPKESVGISTKGCTSPVINHDVAWFPSVHQSSFLFPTFGLNENDFVGKDGESENVCDNTQPTVLDKALTGPSGYNCDSLDFKINSSVPKAGTAESFKVNEHDAGLSLLDSAMDKPVLWMETMGEDRCIVTAAPLAVRYEGNSTSANFLDTEKKSKDSSTEAGTLIDQSVGGLKYCQTEGPSFMAGAFRRDPTESTCVVSDKTTSKLETSLVSLSVEPATLLKQQGISLEKGKIMGGAAPIFGLKRSNLELDRTGDSSKQGQLKRGPFRAEIAAKF